VTTELIPYQLYMYRESPHYNHPMFYTGKMQKGKDRCIYVMLIIDKGLKEPSVNECTVHSCNMDDLSISNNIKNKDRWAFYRYIVKENLPVPTDKLIELLGIYTNYSNQLCWNF